MHNKFRAGIAAIASTVVLSSMLIAGNATASTSTGATARRACSVAPAGYAACHALVRVDRAGHTLVSRNVGPDINPAGYHPADLQKAYKLGAVISRTGTVAVVDAFDNPKAESDLGVYRQQFGLPPCTTANGCFKKLNQNGNPSPLPPTDTGWGEEISLDLDMVSAICPKCKIILVESNTNSFTDLGLAAQKAGSLAHIVSNSYGNAESRVTNPAQYAHYYTHSGVINTVSSGDLAFRDGPQVPAAFPAVVSVGGTALKRSSNARGFTESVWGSAGGQFGAGSGCSKLFAKPAFQSDPKCGKRMIADVSAVADPNTGVSVYDTFGDSGWMVFGGTSASAPIIAGVYALAGHAALQSNAAHIYSHTANLFDVTTGVNGTCGVAYFCQGKPGYDGPTGNGTPNGVGAFS